MFQATVVLVGSDAKRCANSGGTFGILGVFDAQDSPSIKQFQTGVTDLDGFLLNDSSCLPEVTHKELLLHNHTSVFEVVRATESAFSAGDICSVVYSSASSNGQLVVEHAINIGIPIISTMPEKVYSKDFVQSSSGTFILLLPSQKSTLSQPFKEKCIREVMRISKYDNLSSE